MATDYDKELDSIREDLDDLHDNKVDVVKGKQLSTNDFTDEHLRKVNRIETKEYQQEIVAGVTKELERTNDNHVRLADEFHRHLYGQDGVDAKFKKEIQDNLNYMSGLVKSANDRMNEIWQNWDEIVKEDQNHELRLQQVEGKTLTHDALIDSNTSEILNIQGEQVIQNNQIKEMQDKSVELETRVVDVEVSDADQNHRLDIAENRIGTFTDKITALEDGYAQRDARMDGLDAQVSRYTERMLALELNEKSQNDRIKAEEEKNKRQDIDIACLYAEAKDRTITLDTEGTAVELQNSREGFVTINSIEGNTMVNCNKDVDKEVTLLTSIVDKSADNSVTLTEGVVDDGLVDVYLEGNTLVNVSKTKDDYITPSIEDKVDKGSVISLSEASEGYINIDSIEGNTLVNYCTDGSKEMTLNGDIDVEGTFVTTTEGVDNGLVDVMCEGNTLVNLTSTDSVTLNMKTVSKYITLLHDLSAGTYTAIFNLSTNTLDGKVKVACKYYDDETYYPGGVDVGKTGLIKYKFTPTSTVNAVRFYTDTSTSGEAIIENLIILKGDWTNKEMPTEYFEGMKSVGQDDVNGHKVEIVSTNSDESLSNKKEILLNEPLRGLPNGVKDRFVKIGGKWFIERNCKELVLNSLQGLNVSIVDSLTTNSVTTSRIYIAYNINTALFSNVKMSDGGIMCDKLPYKVVFPNLIQENQMAIGKTGAGISLRLQGSTVEECESWLTNNPLKIIYDLATPIYEPLEIEPTLNTYNEVTHLSNNSIIPCNMQIKNSGYNAILKPSTLYTVAVDTDKNGEIGINLAGAKVTTTNNVATITTPSTLTDDSLRLYGKGIKGSKARLLEGDKTNWIPSFFEGMKSSFEDKLQDDGSYKMEILMNNKNIINVPNMSCTPVSNGGWWNLEGNNNSMYNNIDKKTNLYFYAEKGKRYIISFDSKNLDVVQRLKYQQQEMMLPLSTISNENGRYKLLVIGDGLYSTFRFKAKIEDDSTPMEITNFMIIEENLYSNDFVKNEQNKIQFSSIEPLRSTIDGVSDTLIFIDNKLMIERNCGEIIFNGVENWKTLSGVFVLDMDNVLSIDKARTHCDLLSSCSMQKLLNDSVLEGITQRRGSVTGIGLKVRNIVVDSNGVNDLKNWLKSNPIKVVYPLAEPTYEEIPFELQKIILEGYENGTLFFDTNIPPTKVSFNCFEEELTYLYPATSYTVQFTSDKAITVDITLGGTSLLAQNIVAGLNRIAITTPSELVDNKLILDGAGANISKVVVTDTDREFGYFEGMKSVGECEGNEIEILSNNGNLFNMDKWKEGLSVTRGSISFNGNSFTLSSSANDCHTSIVSSGVVPDEVKHRLIQIEEYASYRVGFSKNNTEQAVIYYCWYDASYTPIDIASYYVTSLSDSRIIHAPKRAKYLMYRFGIVFANKSITFSNIFFGTTSLTSYIEPQSNTQQLTHEPLRAVGDVKDKYIMIDGKWYIERNCAEKFLNGVGNTFVHSSAYGLENTIAFETMNFTSETLGTIEVLVSDKFPQFKSWSAFKTEDTMGCYIAASTGFIYFRLPKNLLISEDVSGFIDWVKKNNIKILYKRNAPIYEPINYNPFEVYSDTTHITTNSTIPCNVTVKNHGYNCILKPSTTYTVVSNQGVQNMTTPATLGDSLRFSGNGLLKDVMILEGTLSDNQIPGFFAGMESCYEQKKITDEHDEHFGYYEVTAKVVGKNLFDLQCNDIKLMASPSYDIDDNSITVTYSAPFEIIFNNTKPLRLKAGQYTLNYNHSVISNGGGLIKIVDFYNRSNQIIQGTGTFTLTKDTYVCFVVVRGGTNGTFKISNVQLEQGDTATEYEPYKESVIKFYIKDPLRGIGEVKDKVFIQDDKVIVQRNCGNLVVDSSLSVHKGNTDYDSVNNITFTLGMNNIIAAWMTPNNIVCSTLPSVGNNVWNGKSEGITSDDTKIMLCIGRRKLQTQDINGFRQWLQQNPTKVVYALAEPTYEEAVYSGIRLSQNIWEKSTLFFDTNIPSTANISYSISTPVLDQVAEVSSITDDQDALIIDMATQLAVLNMTI